MLDLRGEINKLKLSVTGEIAGGVDVDIAVAFA